MGVPSPRENLDAVWDLTRLRSLSAADLLSFKLYPCCGEAGAAVHAAIELAPAVAELEIVSIEVVLSPFAMEVLRFPEPTTPDQARFSAHFCVAAAALDGDLSLNTFDEASINRPELRRLMGHTEVLASDSLPAEQSAALTIATRQGRFAREVSVPPGHYELGFSDADLRRKFRSCAQGLVSDSRADSILDACNQLVECGDVGELARMLSVETLEP
jgi:2-methylcitrate dehydratase PrpD